MEVNIRKRQRQAGDEYVNTKGKVVNKRGMKSQKKIVRESASINAVSKYQNVNRK